ncbi:PAAR domain-containing protein [Streptomyces sp. BYX5S]
MPPAARTGDTTSHGTPLTPAAPPGGSPDVLIGGSPAWRAGADTHVCPLVSVNVPHTGGVVAQGSTTVFVDGLPAARTGDRVIETGPPNPIGAGCPTVLIGG